MYTSIVLTERCMMKKTKRCDPGDFHELASQGSRKIQADVTWFYKHIITE